jgi:hypothetical protein
MDFSNRVLGSYLAKRMQERATSVLLTIGRDEFQRADLARVHCYNFTAAANLSAILNRELRVKDTADVFENVHPSALALPRLGAVAIAVLGAAFEAKRLGGDHPLENWVKNHTEHHKVDEIVTFGSLKHQREQAAEATTTKIRKHARRDQAHRLRVSRFTARHSKAS